MSLLECLFLALILYYLVYLVLWMVLDCNVALEYKDRFGKPISTLRGKVVWITGASSGIGRALAVELARHGVRLVLSARRVPQLKEVQSDCLKAAGGVLEDKDILVLPMDILEIEKHQQHFETVIKHFGQLDVLVNNAGRSQRAAWEEIDVQVDRDIFELDVFSVMHLSRIVVRYYDQRQNGRGQIAVTSSVAGFGVVPFSASYCGAKHALNAYMRALKIEKPSMDVTIFAPGPIATDFLGEAFTAVPNAKFGGSTKDQKRMTAERCAHLFAVSIVNKMDLTWCGVFPVNFFAYVLRSPSLTKLMGYLMSGSSAYKLREGKY